MPTFVYMTRCDGCGHCVDICPSDITESFISFLGLGVQEPKTSWGALISEGAGTINYDTEWQLLVPLSFFVVTLFCIYFIGDGLRDALDPKER